MTDMQQRREAAVQSINPLTSLRMGQGRSMMSGDGNQLGVSAFVKIFM